MLAAREKGEIVRYCTDASLNRHVIGMAATMERLEEYRAYNTTFTTRLTQFLSVMFSAQVRLTAQWISTACWNHFVYARLHL